MAVEARRVDDEEDGRVAFVLLGLDARQQAAAPQLELTPAHGGWARTFPAPARFVDEASPASPATARR